MPGLGFPCSVSPLSVPAIREVRGDIKTGHPPPPKENDGQGCPSGLHHVSQWHEQIGSSSLYQAIYIPVNKGARKKIQIGVQPPESERENSSLGI